MQNEVNFRRAQKQIRELKNFYMHLTFFVIIAVLMIVVDLLTTRDALWVHLPILGWGALLVAHGVSVLKLKPWMAKRKSNSHEPAGE